jgi:hypothetical protein
MRVVRKLWRGEYTLPVAFWGFYCGGLLTGFLVALLMFSAGRILFYGGLAVDPIRIASVVWDALFWCYLVVASVAVWRSAEPYWTSPIRMRRFWAGAARVFVVIWIGNVTRVLIDG